MLRRLGDSSSQQKVCVLTFGKHKGKALIQLDDGYLEWLTTIGPQSVAAAAEELLLDRNPTRVLNFGKYKGKQITQVDDAYLQWLVTKYPQSSWWGKAAAEVLQTRGRRQQQGEETQSGSANVRGLLTDLKSCSTTRNLECGRRIHAQALESGNGSSPHVAAALVNMYAKCGSMVDAHQVFDSIKHPDVVSWTALVLGYAKNGEGLMALDLFSRMKSQGSIPNSVTYMAALKACASLALKDEGRAKAECLRRGQQIHSEIGSHANVSVQNTLIDMYAKCGSMLDAHEVFDRMKQPTLVSWTALLLGYVENGEELIALDLFWRMKSKGFVPDSVTYVGALKARASLASKQDASGRMKSLVHGKEIHSEIGRRPSNAYVQSALIEMYAKCNSMMDARQVFENIKHPDVVAWSTLLLGYAENGEGIVTLELFCRMKSEGCTPDSGTYVAALKACASLALKQGSSRKRKCLELGKLIHAEIDCHLTLPVQNALIDMYSKCGSMVDAHEVFDSVEQPSVVSWTALLLGYADNGDGLTAMDLFLRMKFQGCTPNSITFTSVLKSCGLVGALEFGRKVHKEITEYTATLVTSLIDFYAKCGSLAEAREVFDLHAAESGLSAWNALLAGYCSFGDINAGLALFEGMQDAGLRPDEVTFQCLLMCCSHAGAVEKAMECFEAMSSKYRVAPSAEHYTCMVDVLGRANKLDDVIMLLLRIPCSPDAITWLTLLGACCKWDNIEIGCLAFHALLTVDERNAAAYVLMANIYASRCMWEERETMLGMFQAWKASSAVSYSELQPVFLRTWRSLATCLLYSSGVTSANLRKVPR